MNGEGVGKVLQVAHQDTAARVRRIEPLVRVERDRIRRFDACQKRPQVVRENGWAAVGAVDVEPQAVLMALPSLPEVFPEESFLCLSHED